MKTTDKVQVGDSTTSTSTTWHCSYTQPRAEQGWECPRCGRINAPWKSTCDCSGKTYWYPTWEGPYSDEWWKHVTCAPETTWKAPSSMCSSDSSTNDSNKVTTTWSAINNTNSAMNTGGSDYWNSVTKNLENVPHTLTNIQKDLNEIKSTFSSTLKGE